MLPQNHFMVAAVVTAAVIYGFYPEMIEDLLNDPSSGIWPLLGWVVLAGTVAALIDLDVIILTRRAARTDPELVPWSDPMVATKDLEAFLVVIYRKGLFRVVMWTHLAFGVVVTLLAYLLAPSVLVPVAIGAWSHLATDVPYLWRIRKAAVTPTF